MRCVVALLIAYENAIVSPHDGKLHFSDIYIVFNQYTQNPFARYLIITFHIQNNINLRL